MTSDLSVAQILRDLETKIAEHRTQRDHHAEQEVLHRERKDHHEAELERLSQRFEGFKEMAAAVLEVVTPGLTPQPAVDMADLGRAPALSAMVTAVVGSVTSGAFGATWVTAEIERRYGKRLKGKIESASVAAKLRRMQAAGQLHQVRGGRPYHEALYSKEQPEG